MRAPTIREIITLINALGNYSPFSIFLPISVWKIGQQSIGVGLVVVGDLKTFDQENSFSLFLAYNGEKIFFLHSKLNQSKPN